MLADRGIERYVCGSDYFCRRSSSTVYSEKILMSNKTLPACLQCLRGRLQRSVWFISSMISRVIRVIRVSQRLYAISNFFNRHWFNPTHRLSRNNSALRVYIAWFVRIQITVTSYKLCNIFPNIFNVWFVHWCVAQGRLTPSKARIYLDFLGFR